MGELAFSVLIAVRLWAQGAHPREVEAVDERGGGGGGEGKIIGGQEEVCVCVCEEEEKERTTQGEATPRPAQPLYRSEIKFTDSL